VLDEVILGGHTAMALDPSLPLDALLRAEAGEHGAKPARLPRPVLAFMPLTSELPDTARRMPLAIVLDAGAILEEPAVSL
jgi:hypothetical protein